MPVTRIVTLLVATGCGTSITSTELNTSPRPMFARSPESVELFTSAPPGRPYVDVAYLRAEQQSDMSIDGTDAFIRKLRTRAAEMGCDGVVFGAETNRPATSAGDIAFDIANALTRTKSDPPPGYGDAANLRGLLATCIVWMPEPGEAEAVSEVGNTMYDACLRQRAATLRAAQRLDSPSARGRMLRLLPTCTKV